MHTSLGLSMLFGIVKQSGGGVRDGERAGVGAVRVSGAPAAKASVGSEVHWRLSTAGYEVLTASDAAEAQGVARASRPRWSGVRWMRGSKRGAAERGAKPGEEVWKPAGEVSKPDAEVSKPGAEVWVTSRGGFETGAEVSPQRKPLVELSVRVLLENAPIMRIPRDRPPGEIDRDLRSQRSNEASDEQDASARSTVDADEVIRGIERVETINLHFEGPLTFTPGERSLFQSTVAECIYLWTIKSAFDQQYLVHYVGEASSFAARQREHLVHVLGMNYGIYDVPEARRGALKSVWSGMWRDRSQDGPSRLLETYATATRQVLAYVEAIDVFVGEIEGDAALRRHVEGMIGRNLRNNHSDKKALYPDDNRIGIGAKRGIELRVTTEAAIAGVGGILEI